MVTPLKWGAGKKKTIANMVILCFLGLFPFFGGDYDTVLVARIFCFAILALSLDLIWGYAGLLSFGHGAFFGLGAYGLGLTLKYCDFPGVSYVGVLIGIFGAAGVAAILGHFLFYGRVSGIYFGIITLAFTTILWSLCITLFHITGGQNGLYGAFLQPSYGIPWLLEYQRTRISSMTNYYTCLVAFALSYCLCRFIVKSPFGRILLAIKNNEERLECLGYNVANFKIAIFAISAGLAGFAGSMSVPIQFIAPTVFGLLFSTSVIIWVAVGGRGTLIGPIIGAFFVKYMEDWLSTQFEYLWVLFMGVLFVLIVVFHQGGVLMLFRSLFDRAGRGGNKPSVGDSQTAPRTTVEGDV